MIKKSLILIYDKEKWWMLDIDKCNLMNEC